MRNFNHKGRLNLSIGCRQDEIWPGVYFCFSSLVWALGLQYTSCARKQLVRERYVQVHAYPWGVEVEAGGAALRYMLGVANGWRWMLHWRSGPRRRRRLPWAWPLVGLHMQQAQLLPSI